MATHARAATMFRGRRFRKFGTLIAALSEENSRVVNARILFEEDPIMPECPICGATVTLAGDTVEGELIPCPECGSELEVKRVNPFVLAEAPKEEEDWGE
jgi:alpha-aminoadipate carrier protein LysW